MLVKNTVQWQTVGCPYLELCWAVVPLLLHLQASTQWKKGKDSLSVLLTSLWCCRITERVLGTSRGSWATLRTARLDSDMVPKGLWFIPQIQDKPSTGGSLKLGVYRNTLVSLFKVLISKPTFRESQGLEFTADSVSDGDLAPSVLYTSQRSYKQPHLGLLVPTGEIF